MPDRRIKEIVEETTLHIPSSFDSQATHVVVLIGAEHEKFVGHPQERFQSRGTGRAMADL